MPLEALVLDSKARVQLHPRRTALATAGLLVLVSGCSSEPGSRLEVVPASAFRAPQAPSVGQSPSSGASRLSLGDPAGPIPVESARPAPSWAATDSAGPSSAADGASQPGVSTSGASSVGASQPIVPVPIEADGAREPVDPASYGALALVDAKVGDVNGRAIYASEFLAEMAPRLIQLRTQVPDDQWLAQVSSLVRLKLDSIIEEELLRAEAIAALPEDARTIGLAAFVERVRANLKSQSRGSSVLAGQRLADEGRSIDEFLLRTRDSAVVRELLQNRIIKRVQVGMRDIVQDYERRYAEFNPDAQISLRMIRVPASDAEGVEAVTAALRGGAAFEGVASAAPNTHRRDTGGLIPSPIAGELQSAAPFRSDALNEATRVLAPGEHTDAIDVDGVVHWVYLDGIERRSASLYEAQVTLASDRSKIEVERELNRFVGRLKDRASFTGVDEMANRLIAIAVERYASDELRVRMLGVD